MNVSIRDINPMNGEGVIIPGAVNPSPGTSVSASLPNEVSAVITKRTGVAGRSGRGRMYMVGFATNGLGAGNVIAQALVTALQTWATSNVGAALAGSGYTHVLALMGRAGYTSPLTGRVFPPRSATSLDITSLEVRDNHWDSQRRRGLK
jgi:hypothetical protein